MIEKCNKALENRRDLHIQQIVSAGKISGQPNLTNGSVPHADPTSYRTSCKWDDSATSTPLSLPTNDVGNNSREQEEESETQGQEKQEEENEIEKEKEQSTVNHSQLASNSFPLWSYATMESEQKD